MAHTNDKDRPGPELRTRKTDRGTISDHESFGQLCVVRARTTPKASLYGSHLEHSELISFTLYESELHRSDLHYDHVLPRRTLAKWSMSPAQFAELITSLGNGTGTPCTLEWFDGKEKAPTPRVNKREQFAQEFGEEIKSLVQRMTELKNLAHELLKQKGAMKVADKKRLAKAIFEMCRVPEDHIPWIGKMFHEMMDKTVHEAKQEFEAFQEVILRAQGLEALKDLPENAPNPPALPDDQDPE